MLLVCLVAASLLHDGFELFDLLTDSGGRQSITQRDFFAFDYGSLLNLAAIMLSLGLGWMAWQSHDHDAAGTSLADRVLQQLTLFAVLWLIGGLIVGSGAAGPGVG